ncbi:MAG: flagellar motor switch protein FliN, partial [Clostridia bacterium]|nr:flagellar motor switch protein FliN [Clostridia bacterium]
LMGGNGNIDPNNIVLDEISLSAIREVMNQMVGSSATSLASMLHKTINISTPSSRRIVISQDKLGRVFQQGDIVLKIAFKMEIENLLTSEIMQILPIEFSRQIADELLNPLAEDGDAGRDTWVEPEKAENVYTAQPANYMPEPQTAAPEKASEPKPVQPQPPQQPAQPQPPRQIAQQAAAPQSVGQSAVPPPFTHQEPGQGQQPFPPGYYPYSYPPYGYPVAYPPQTQQQIDPSAAMGRQKPGNTLKTPESVNVKEVEYPQFTAPGPGADGRIETQNLWRLLDVPMEVTVELGRCTKTIKQVLDMNVGSVVVLDKLAGEMVEVLVNGIQVARGEVVVIDDSYGVRITELNAAELSEITKNG